MNLFIYNNICERVRYDMQQHQQNEIQGYIIVMRTVVALLSYVNIYVYVIKGEIGFTSNCSYELILENSA